MTDSNLAASLTLSFRVPRSPMEVFDTINRVSDWWIGEIEGNSDAEGAVFTYQYKPYHRTVQQVVQLVPGKRIVWKVLESSIHFVKDEAEWKDTAGSRASSRQASISPRTTSAHGPPPWDVR